MKTLEQRFWAKVHKTDTCWLWTAAKINGGYGSIGYGDKMVLAHRLSWELHNGPTHEELCVLHKCDAPACVNPDHLFLGTHADNMTDMTKKGRRVSTPRSGESNGRAKLTVAQVRDIRAREGQSQRALAKEFGLGQTQISHILSGKGWAHI